MNNFTYEIRQIDAWTEEGNGWTWNTSYYMGDFATSASDHKKPFSMR